ncbi:MAG: hypothetical protein ACE5FA_13800 [Dehalococcoidia bacterium]
MATKTYQLQLEQVQAAIDAIELRGQSYAIGERTLKRSDLGELYRREERLRRLAKREAAGGGIRARYGTPA